MDKYILAINPGSTSTKVALFANDKEEQSINIEHDSHVLESYPTISSQYEMRYQAIMAFLKAIEFDPNKLAATVGRGGLLPPVKSGAYQVNEAMVDRLMHRPVVEHASNLGGIIAKKIADDVGKKAYIYDSVAVDELSDVARISGIKSIPRKSFSHCLNMRAVALKVAADNDESYDDHNYVVAHLGGGISVSVHSQGKMIDIVSDDEGPFSPERSGRVPCKDLVKACFKEGASKVDVMKSLRGHGGLVSYLGTNSALEVEDRIKSGDQEAEMVYKAMAYQIAKGIGEMATVVDGKVSNIIVTGGMAHSKMLTEWIKKKVEFIAPVILVPGENEMASLAKGTLRVLAGEEEARSYDLG